MLVFALSRFASDLIVVLPLTDTILMLHFTDGRVLYHGYHETEAADSMVGTPLDTARASTPGTYQVKSASDADYGGGGRSPIAVGRKSKGSDYSRKCRWTGSKCVNDIVFDHWVYLVLPNPTKRGVSYTVSAGNLASNLGDTAIIFDE